MGVNMARGAAEAAVTYSGGLIGRFGQFVKRQAGRALEDGSVQAAARNTEEGVISRTTARGVERLSNSALSGSDAKAAAVGGGVLASALAAATLPVVAIKKAQDRQVDAIASKAAEKVGRHGGDDTKKVIINT